jgi:uncharacterized membrane protein
MEKVKVEQHSGVGGLWLIGWIFSIGFLELGFLKAVLAILIWPYFLGDALGEEVFAPPAAVLAAPEAAGAAPR